jgi:hypothetical protein
LLFTIFIACCLLTDFVKSNCGWYPIS